LKVASPATVSRCGMVYMEPVHLGWKPLIKTWNEVNVDVMPSNFLDLIVKNVEGIFDKLLPFVKEQCRETIDSAIVNLV
jgi:dynein heavy chain, axonemal